MILLLNDNVQIARKQDDGVDPLDAFMANEVNPEVRAKEQEEAERRAAELRERAQQRAVRLPLMHCAFRRFSGGMR